MIVNSQEENSFYSVNFASSALAPDNSTSPVVTQPQTPVDQHVLDSSIVYFSIYQTREVIMSLTATQKTLRGLTAVAALFFISVGTMSFMSSRLATLNTSTLHTYQVICELKDTLSALLDVETGNRGYALTHKKNFLEPLEWGIKNARNHLSVLEDLLHEPGDAESFEKLRKLADEKIAFSKKVVEFADQSNQKGADFVGEGQGKQIMDRFREAAGEIASRKQQLLANKVSELAVAAADAPSSQECARVQLCNRGSAIADGGID